MPEYGRELWEGRHGTLLFEDMEAIALEQVKREEEAVVSARRFVFCDTTPLTTLFYSEATFGSASDRLRAAAARPYDLTVLCDADIPFVQDGTRQPESFRDRQQLWYEQELNSRRIPYILAKGSLEQRVATISASLGQLT